LGAALPQLQLRLSDFEISSNVLYRSLIPGGHANCQRCSQPLTLGHHEVCQRIVRFVQVSRHDQVKLTLAPALNTISSFTVEVEPTVPFTDLVENAQRNSIERRNEIRIKGSAMSGLSDTDFDVTVTSLCGVAARRVFSERPRDEDPQKDAMKRINEWVPSRRQEKINCLSLNPGSTTTLLPLVFTSGGCTDTTASTLLEWKRLIAPGTYGYMQSRLSIGLARARGCSFLQ